MITDKVAPPKVVATVAPSAPSQSHGRCLDSSLDAHIMSAALDLVAELGYDNVSMDAIASRAHVSKATIYRRWDSKAALVVHAVRCRDCDQLPELPDTGNLRDDLVTGLRAMTQRLRQEDLALMTGLLTAMRSDPELAGLIREQMVTTKRAASQAFVARAIERGQLPASIDLTVLDEVAPAMVFTRLVITGEPVDEAFVVHLVDDIVLPVLTNAANSVATKQF